jgi:hypothetical protein
MLRRLLLAILVFGMTATSADLLLLDHVEDTKQLIPLALIALAGTLLVWRAVRGGAGPLRLFQLTMVLFVLAGITGTVLHYQGNLAFQLEIDPAASGPDLFWKVMRAKAPPALAPGSMVQLGLLGLVYTYRHPGLDDGGKSAN